MRPLRVFALLIAFSYVAAPLPGQVIDSELSNRALELDLWGAEVRIVLQPGATPRLEAWAVRGKETTRQEGPAVDFEEQADALKVFRIEEREAEENENITVHVDVTLDIGHPILVLGSEINLAIQGPPLDIEEMKMLRELAEEDLRELPAPDWSDIKVSLTDSRADIFGISGAQLEGRNSYFVVRQSTNELRVEIDGGAVEIDQHRGILGLAGHGELTARNAVGMYELAVKGGDVELNGAKGQVKGTVTNTSLNFFDWQGMVEIESQGGSVEMRAFRPGSQQMVKLTAEDTEVAIEGLEEGMVDLKQRGGKLLLRDITGKMKVDARQEAELEMERLGGSWQASLQDSELQAEEVEQLALEIYSSKVEMAEVESLKILAQGSEITASGIKRLDRSSLARSTADLKLTAGASGELFIRNETQAKVLMETPCIVSAEGAVETQAGASLDVLGCQEGLGPEGLQGADSGSDPQSRLRVSVGRASAMEVRAQQ